MIFSTKKYFDIDGDETFLLKKKIIISPIRIKKINKCYIKPITPKKISPISKCICKNKLKSSGKKIKIKYSPIRIQNYKYERKNKIQDKNYIHGKEYESEAMRIRNLSLEELKRRTGLLTITSIDKNKICGTKLILI